MEKFREQLEEIKRILLSSSDLENSDKTSAFQTLYELATTNDNSSSIELLGHSANVLVSSLVPDIFDDDAEIGSHALKCLGSMLYHPSVVAHITYDNALIIVDSLVKVITSIRIKSICKLAVWCISVQQFSAAMLDAHFHSLLKAVVHALDNPIGSLSITFEAMEALVKLANLWGEKMREMSNFWVPPIYRRLVSVNNREREMTEKFLPKIEFIIFPAPVSLSKVLLLDVKNSLLAAMIELMNTGMKIQTIKAWGWFIHLLGPNAMKSKHLANEILKMAEQAFGDVDPQVQIAALVAWESMIDASALFPVQACKSDSVSMSNKEHIALSKGNSCQIEEHKFLRKIKLIMTPLIEIMSSKCDKSVHVACLKTWSYLLQKLDTSISSDLVMKSVLEPLFRVFFQVGPHRDALSWSICLDLLDAFTSAGISHANSGRHGQKNSKFSENNSVVGHLLSNKSLWNHYAIKWSPWDLHQLDFFVRMVCSIINQASNAAVSPQFRKLAQNSALKLFRSLLRAVQSFVTSIATSYDEIMLCMITIFRFLKELCENESSKDGNIIDLPNASLQLLEMIAGEVDASILGSSLYKLALDIKCLDKLDPLGIFRYSSSTGIRCVSYMDGVPPIVYLNVLFFSLAMKLTSEVADLNAVTDRLYRHIKFCLCSYDTLGSLDLFVGLLLKHEPFDCLAIWRTLAICLKDQIDDKTHPSPLIIGSKNPSYPILLHLLTYPFSICLHHFRYLNIDIQNVLEVWKLLYASVNHEIHLPCSPLQKFTEDISLVLIGYLDHVTNTSGSKVGTQEGNSMQNTHLLFFIGNVDVCILEQLILGVTSRKNEMRNDNNEISSSIRSCVKLSSRFLKVAVAKVETYASIIQPLTIRLFLTLIKLVSSLDFKGSIIAFIETMEICLLEWLSLEDTKDDITACHLPRLWTEVLNSLRRSRPSIKFDSPFLKFQASLLEKTLGHWNFTISASTINFWNSTYGRQTRLEHPQSLLSILDKLYIDGKVNICKTNLAINGKGSSRITTIAAPRVYATLNSCSKRVELEGNSGSDLWEGKEMHLSLKRRKIELTEHQKEVRRAQQGLATDCHGHGPGIRTYTSVDFSQGNEDESQESQVI